MYGEIIPDRTSAQATLYLTGTMKSSVVLQYYGVSRVKDWVSVDCGTPLISVVFGKIGSFGHLFLFFILIYGVLMYSLKKMKKKKLYMLIAVTCSYDS